MMLTLRWVIFFLLILYPTAVFSESEDQTAKDEIWVSGAVVWPGNEIAHASVEVFKDPQFKNLYTRGLLLKPDGAYAIAIEEPGTYYMVAFVDQNGNAIFDTGDAMGIYGILDWEDSSQKPKPLSLAKGTKLTGIDIPITAAVDSQGRVRALPAYGSSPNSGISGKIIWPDPGTPPENEISNIIVFAYSDPTWSNRIGQTETDVKGEYVISLPAGRYYLIAVIDENNTNLLDAGDKFGIWGMTRFGAFPKPVIVEEGQFVKNRNILIIGEMGISGKASPLHTIKAEKTDDPGSTVTISGNVLWSGRNFKTTVVQAYSDPSMTTATAQTITDDKGKFKLTIPSGEYYLVAIADVEGDGKYTTGDGIGAYGVANAAEEMPKKLKVAKEKNIEINMVITAEFDKSGQLKPIPPTLKSVRTDNSSIVTGEAIPDMQGISGKIVWEGCDISGAILVFSKDQKFENGIRVSLQLEEDGKYVCSSPSGDYYIMAVVDINTSNQIDAGDGIGLYGSGYWSEPQKVTVIQGNITPYINIGINSVFGTDGQILPMQTPGTIRFQYGEPDMISKDDSNNRMIQEWWYWEKGMSFTFEKLETGWNLIDSNEFPPMAEKKEKATQPAVEEKEGIIYYTFDSNIWAITANGTKRKWVAQGTCPTTTADGGKMLHIDTNGNIYLIEPRSESPGKMIVGRRKSGFQPAISNSGKAIAFTQQIGEDRQIFIKNLETNEESPITINAEDIYHPAWTSDDQGIAYSALLSSQMDNNRDIYHYDFTSKRVERITMDPLDEFDPTWSLVDNKTLVYCRAEGEHSQLWIVNFDVNGKPAERQLTRYGGRSPAWSPEGNKIIYENNSQLWTINPDGSDEKPIIINNEPVFGMDPFWTR